MGVNRVGFGIIDDEAVKDASKQEIIRRCFSTEGDFKKGLIDEEILNHMKLIMEEVGLKKEDRVPVAPARRYAEKIREHSETTDMPAVIAFELADGQIVTGRTTPLMDSCSAAILNSIKVLAHISDEIHLLSPNILETIQKLKVTDLHSKISALNSSEVLIALAISAVTNPTAQLAYNKLAELKDVQAHSTVMLNKDDEQTLRKLGLDITCDPFYPSENLYYI